jgi:hypothetical protein
VVPPPPSLQERTYQAGLDAAASGLDVRTLLAGILLARLEEGDICAVVQRSLGAAGGGRGHSQLAGYALHAAPQAPRAGADTCMPRQPHEQ